MRGQSRPANLARYLRSCAAFALLGVWLTAACGGEDSPYNGVENWECFERKLVSNAGGAGGAGGASATSGAGGTGGTAVESASCDCFGVSSGVQVGDARPAVSSCSGWRCCYAWPTDAGAFDCRCEDEPQGAQLAGFCATAAAERGGEVVDNCPPTPRDNAAYCAFQGESCTPEYLEEQDLNGCCASLACVADTYGSLVCR